MVPINRQTDAILAGCDLPPRNTTDHPSHSPLATALDLAHAHRARPQLDPAKGGATPYVTSRYFRAPELLCGSAHYGQAVDTWAVACTVAELYLGSASLNDPEAAAVIALRRGEGTNNDAKARLLWKRQQVQLRRKERLQEAGGASDSGGSCEVSSRGGGAQRPRRGGVYDEEQAGGELALGSGEVPGLRSVKKRLFEEIDDGEEEEGGADEDDGDSGGYGHGADGGYSYSGGYSYGDSGYGGGRVKQRGAALETEEAVVSGDWRLPTARCGMLPSIFVLLRFFTLHDGGCPCNPSPARTQARSPCLPHPIAAPHCLTMSPLQEALEARAADLARTAASLAAGCASPVAGRSAHVYARAYAVLSRAHDLAALAQAEAEEARVALEEGVNGTRAGASSSLSPTPPPLEGHDGVEGGSAAAAGAYASCYPPTAATVREVSPPGSAYSYSLFHGAANDGSQLAHIINLLGTPTSSEIAAMRLPPQHEKELRGIVATIANALGVALPKYEGLAPVPRPGSAPYDSAPSASSSSSSSSPSVPAASSASTPSAPTRVLQEKPIGSFLARRFVPPDVADLLANMLRWAPEDRMTPSRALDHAAMRAFPAITVASRHRIAQTRRIRGL